MKIGTSANRNRAPDAGSPRRAFTLIEIMVAIMLFMLVVAAVYSTWILLLKSSAIGQEAAARAQSERIAVRTIEDSLTCIQSFQASMQYYDFTVTNGDDASLSFTARLPDIFPRNGRFGGFDLRRLTFSIETGPDSQKDLMLRQNPILMDMDSTEKNLPLVLAHNVTAFTIECWDTNAQDWATEWDDTNSIPGAILVTLSLGGNGGPPVSITRLIAVPSSTVPLQVQQPMLGGGGRGGGGGGNGGNGGGGNGVGNGGGGGNGGRGGGNGGGNGGRGGGNGGGNGGGGNGFNPGGGRGGGRGGGGGGGGGG